MIDPQGPLRLKLVVTADFRKTEQTNWIELEAAGEIPKNLKPGDVVCMVSSSRNQVVFVFPPYEHAHDGKVIRVINSRRLRISGGAWNPLMLQNYAADVGLRLSGITRFEEHFVQQRRTELEKEAQKRKENAE